jgi:hypothetical protein
MISGIAAGPPCLKQSHSNLRAAFFRIGERAI